MREELKTGRYDFDFSYLKTLTANSKNILLVDLMPLYLDYSKKSGLPYSDFYWKIDAHHNSRGYKMMAECIAEEILE